RAASAWMRLGRRIDRLKDFGDGNYTTWRLIRQRVGERRDMRKGFSNKLVGQTGEYLVAAELSRRGLIATTFTGNVPHYDIIASHEIGRHVSVQVKASRGPSWHFGSITQYCDIT